MLALTGIVKGTIGAPSGSGKHRKCGTRWLWGWFGDPTGCLTGTNGRGCGC